MAKLTANALTLIQKAASGDIAFKISPATTTRAATSAAWTRNVEITLETAAGEIHEWFTGDITVSIGDTSTAGTASITDTTPTMIDGRCTVVVSGDAAAWLAAETNTLTVAQATIIGYTVSQKTSVETIE